MSFLTFPSNPLRPIRATSSVPETEDEARQMVRDQQAADANFIKPYDWLPRDIYFALMDEAEKLGVYTDGHTEKLAEWQNGGRLINWQGQQAYRRSSWRPALMQLTKAMQDHGALLTLGTDVSVEGVVPGYSAHLELPLLVEAGLSPYEALATGTRNAAQVTERMGADSDWGTVVEGNRADLILLTNNPLADVTHTQDRLGVMVRGQWFTQAKLDNLVGEFVATYEGDTGVASE